MGLRAGLRPRALVTTTPRPMRLLNRIRDDRRTIVTGARSTSTSWSYRNLMASGA
jgi:phage terminase large subunit-like protein